MIGSISHLDNNNILFSSDQDVIRLHRNKLLENIQTEFPTSTNIPLSSYEPDDYEDYNKIKEKLYSNNGCLFPHHIFSTLKYLFTQYLYEIYSVNTFESPRLKETYEGYSSNQENEFELSFEKRHNLLQYHMKKILSCNDDLDFQDYLLIFYPLLCIKLNSIYIDNKFIRLHLAHQLQLLKDRQSRNEEYKQKNFIPRKLHCAEIFNSSLKNLEAETQPNSVSAVNQSPKYLDLPGLELSSRNKELMDLSHAFNEKQFNQTQPKVINSHDKSSYNTSKIEVNETQNSANSRIDNFSNSTNSNVFSSFLKNLNSRNRSNPSIYMNPQKTAWIVSWIDNDYEIRRKFHVNEHGLQNAKDLAHNFHKSLSNNNTVTASEENKNLIKYSQNENERMITRQITSSKFQNKSKTMHNSPSSLSLSDNNDDPKVSNQIGTSDYLESVSYSSESSLYNSSISQTSQKINKNSDSSKFRLKNSSKVRKEHKHSITRGAPGRPRVRTQAPIVEPIKNKSKGDAPPGKSYNIAKENISNYKPEELARYNKLKERASKYPFCLGVLFEVQNFAWIAKMDDEVRRFLVKKHGWKKAYDYAVNRILTWRIGLEAQRREEIKNQENEILSELIREANLSHIDNNSISSDLQTSKSSDTLTDITFNDTNNSSNSTVKKESMFLDNSFSAVKEKKNHPRKIIKETISSGKIYSSKGNIQDFMFQLTQEADSFHSNSDTINNSHIEQNLIDINLSTKIEHPLNDLPISQA